MSTFVLRQNYVPWSCLIFQTNYSGAVGVLSSALASGCAAQRLRDLSILFNDVLLGTSGSDAVSLHIIYYTFGAVSQLSTYLFKVVVKHC